MRVLVVEGEVRLAEMLRRGLVADGFTVEVEHDGDNGFHSAATGEFDALVLDIMLPGKMPTPCRIQTRPINDMSPPTTISAIRINPPRGNATVFGSIGV